MKNLNKSSVKDATTNATLDRIVSEYRSAIKKITTCSDNSMDDTMATMLCNSMCGNLDICNSIVSVCSPIGNHYVLALELEENAWNKYFNKDDSIGELTNLFKSINMDNVQNYRKKFSRKI